MSEVITKYKLENWIEQGWQSFPLLRSLPETIEQLPDRPGLYSIFARKIMYVGKSRVSIRSRWKNHHKKSHLKLLQEMEIPVKIYCWTVPNWEYTDELKIEVDKMVHQLEQKLIKTLSPSLNGVI